MSDLPDAQLLVTRGGLWYRLPEADSHFIHLGIAPKPLGVFQTIVYHIAHGVLMKYPLCSIIRYAAKNRNSFKDNGE